MAMARRSASAVVAFAVVCAALCVALVDAPDARAADPDETAAESPEPATPPPSLRVAKLQFRGNRKVEDDAIKVNLKTAPGATLTQEILRDDVRAIWKMG